MSGPVGVNAAGQPVTGEAILYGINKFGTPQGGADPAAVAAQRASADTLPNATADAATWGITPPSQPVGQTPGSGAALPIYMPIAAAVGNGGGGSGTLLGNGGPPLGALTPQQLAAGGAGGLKTLLGGP